METLRGSIYDYPKYYDLLFGSDWKAEFDFFSACFRLHARRPVRRLFEPACGTGRLLFRFAKAGYDVCGLDLNPKAVEYCNRRLQRHGLPPAAFVGDMSDFKLKRKADAAFNPINSFRELRSERQAEKHLRCMARCLARGGLYLLCLHLTPQTKQQCVYESWSARRGHLGIVSKMKSLRVDRRRRKEYVLMQFDVYTPTRTFRVRSDMVFRTYTARQMMGLLKRVGGFEIAATYDFRYDLGSPITVGPDTEDVVLVLRKV